MFEPKYKLTNKIVSMLTEIAENRAIIARARILPAQELKLRRQALIRMTHSSTGIEGNILNLGQVEALYRREKIDAPDRDVYEVQNYIKALQYIGKIVKERRAISEKVFLKIHNIVTNNTLSKDQSGHYRKGMVYVVKRRLGFSDEIVYTAADPAKAPQLTLDLINWIKNSEAQNINPVIAAGIAHQEIAAIHPFADGNGRTARAVATLVLYQRGYDFRQLFALEYYYNNDRPKYYQAINIGKNYEERKTDFTSWLEYFVKGFKEEIEITKTKIITLARRKVDSKLESQIYLVPEQLKIIDFMEQVGRITKKDVVDILNCPPRTAQLHLQKLKKLKMIVQTGKGPSSAYLLS
jgi:Fic family protein